jgi:hypothetical protein
MSQPSKSQLKMKTKDCTTNAKTEKTKDERHRKKENISIAEVDAKTEKTKDSEVW